MSQNGKTTGPFEEERLAMLVRWGRVSRDAFIGDTQWSAWIAIRRSAFAQLLPQPGGSGGGTGPDSSIAATERETKQALGLLALSAILAGLLIAAL